MRRPSMIPGGLLVLMLPFAFALASPGLAHAQDMDACINASEKSLGLRKSQKLVDARKELSTCASASCPDAVRTSCQQRLAEVMKAIPSIVLFIKDGAGHDLAAVKLTIDGAPYANRLDGSAIVLDPGEHEFRFESAGQPPLVQRFVLHENEQNRRENVVLGPAPATPIPKAPTASPPDSPPSDGSTQRTVGLVVGGVGLAGLAVGGLFGALSIAAHNSYEQNCGANIGAPPGQCNAQGVSGENDAANKGTLSTVSFIAGGIATAVGVALYFLAPSGRSVQVGVGPGSLVLGGGF